MSLSQPPSFERKFEAPPSIYSNNPPTGSRVRWGGGGVDDAPKTTVKHPTDTNYASDQDRLNKMERAADQMVAEEDDRRRLFDLLSANLATSTQPSSELTDKARLKALKEHRIISVLKTYFPDDVFNNDADIRLHGPPLPGAPSSSSSQQQHRKQTAPDVVDFIQSFLGTPSDGGGGGDYSVSHLLPVNSRHDAGNDACYALIPKDCAEKYLADLEVRDLIDGLLRRELALLDAQVANEMDAIRCACEEEASLQIQQARVREASNVFEIKLSETRRLLEKAEEIRSRKSIAAASPFGSTRGFMSLQRQSNTSATDDHDGRTHQQQPNSKLDGGLVPKAVADVLNGHKELHDAIHELNRHRKMKAANGNGLSASSAHNNSNIGGSSRGWKMSGGVSRFEANLSSILSPNGADDISYYGEGASHRSNGTAGAKNVAPALPNNNNNPYLSPPSHENTYTDDATDEDGHSVRSAISTAIFSPAHVQGRQGGSFSHHRRAIDPHSEQSITASTRRDAQEVLRESDPALFRRILKAADEYRNNELQFDEEAVARQREEEADFARELEIVSEVRSDQLDLEVGKLTTQRLIIESGPHALGARTLELYDLLSQLAVVRKAMSLEEEYLGIAQSNALAEQDRFQTFEQLKEERDEMLGESRRRLAEAHEMQRIARTGFLVTYRRLTGQEPLPVGGTNTFLDPQDTKDAIANIRAELAAGECTMLLGLCKTNCEDLLPSAKDTWEATRHWYN